MTTYAIGDIQGCYQSFRYLLEQLNFDPAQDRLWIAGDLVNRGPDSLQTLRYIRSIESSVSIVLGNHDLHMLAVYYGRHKLRRKDTIQEIFDAPDCEELMDWLRQYPLMVWDQERNLAMTHAGIPHIWKIKKAWRLANEVSAILRSDQYELFFREMYGNYPAKWKKGLEGMDRARAITNYLTRMRFIKDNGKLDFTAKAGLDSAPEGYQPWFRFKREDKTRIVFGHWAALNGKTGRKRFIATDTGCVWGGQLSAINLETFEATRCGCVD